MRTSYAGRFALLAIFIIQFVAVNKAVPSGDLPAQDRNASYSDGLPDWALLDPDMDGYEGVRTKTFYRYLQTLDLIPERTDVIVGVIDSGFDIDHPDLAGNIWTNESEANGSPGVDDDNNGYVDDIHGWNFLGNAKYISYEVAREYKRLKDLKTPPTDAYYKKVKEEYEEKYDEVMSTYDGLKWTLKDLEDAEKTLMQKNITTDPEKLQGISMTLKGKYSDAASVILGVYLLYGSKKSDVEQLLEKYEIKKAHLFDTTSTYLLVGDNPDDLFEKGYGNPDVDEKKESHGTHVAGIIASRQTGQAPFAKLMLLRAVPNEGDERDKDVANAIRYAVDNGASVINMSAGKYFSPNPDIVVEAIRYAESKGVLFVVSAGNEGADASKKINYPQKFIDSGSGKEYFSNMLVVGASSWMKQWDQDKDPKNQNSQFDLLAPFSNYSKEVVDVFAPGSQINSTVPGGKYDYLSGTSMAAPVVSGIAAVLKSYYPALTAQQLKQVIASSVRQYDKLMVKVRNKKDMYFSELSKTGGVVDLLNAYRLAGTLSN
ncbi:MAG: S8 family serine peptidase [Ignavibacteria bacterium]|nr:S8 family serine peptidase [Ignavibacteria bacterium]